MLTCGKLLLTTLSSCLIKEFIIFVEGIYQPINKLITISGHTVLRSVIKLWLFFVNAMNLTHTLNIVSYYSFLVSQTLIEKPNYVFLP